MLRVPDGKRCRQFQYQISSVFQRRSRAGARRKQSGRSALRKAAAHQTDDRRVRENSAYLRKLVCMAPVKGVILTDNANGRQSPKFLHFQYLLRYRSVCAKIEAGAF